MGGLAGFVIGVGFGVLVGPYVAGLAMNAGRACDRVAYDGLAAGGYSEFCTVRF